MKPIGRDIDTIQYQSPEVAAYIASVAARAAFRAVPGLRGKVTTNQSREHECDACHDEIDELDPCPVCLGAGRISDVMPQRDSEADAETLRIHYAPPQDKPWMQRVGARISERALVDVVWTCAAFPDAISAERIARAAFRAVPGLRGE